MPGPRNSSAAPELHREVVRPIFIGVVIDQPPLAKQQIDTLSLTIGAEFVDFVVNAEIGLLQPLAMGLQLGSFTDDACHLMNSHAGRDTILEQPIEIFAIVMLDVGRSSL